MSVVCLHCPKNNLESQSIETEPVTAGADATRNMSGFCLYIYSINISGIETRYIIVLLLRLFLGQCIAFPPSSMRLTHGEGPFAPPPRLVCLGDRTGSAYNSVLSSGVALLQLA